MKMKIISHRYDVNRHKYSKYKKPQYDDACMYWATPKQQLGLNSWKSEATLGLSWKKELLFKKSV